MTSVSSLARDVARGQVAERGVRLQHLPLGRPDRPDLEEVVHHGQELKARVVRGAGHRGQVRAEAGRAVLVGEIRDLHTELHVGTSSDEALTPTGLATRRASRRMEG